MIEAKTMDDLVRDKMAKEQYAVGKEQTDELRFAGYETLHQRSLKEIAACFANVLKSRPNIKHIDWEIGKPIKITYVVQ
jgi:hypothetical protein